MKRKWIGYGDFFCSNCGKRIVKGKRKCPDCGMYYNDKRKYNDLSLIKKVNPSLKHQTIRNFTRNTILNYLIWIVLLMILIPPFIYLFDSGDVSYEYIYHNVVPYLYPVLFGPIIIFIILSMRGFKASKLEIAEENKKRKDDVKCVCCKQVSSRYANYCSRCGAILIKGDDVSE